MTAEVFKQMVGQYEESVHKSNPPNPQGEIRGCRRIKAEQKVLPAEFGLFFLIPRCVNIRSRRRPCEMCESDGERGEETMRTVGRKTLVDKGLGQTQCQNKKNSEQTKRKKPQKASMSVRIGRWKVKRDDTAIDKVWGVGGGEGKRNKRL